MPAAMTPMQRLFAMEYASNGGNATAAAKAAGYSLISAHEIGRQQLQKAHVREAIHSELLKLRSGAGVIGLAALESIAANDKCAPAARVAASRTLMEFAGMIGPAKDIKKAREEADGQPDPEAKFHDIGEVLDQLGRARSPQPEMSDSTAALQERFK